MNNNYETTQAIMEGADLLYTVLQELIIGINHLPGCKVTAHLKKVASNVGIASGNVYRTMQKIVAAAETSCDECYDDAEDYGENDVPESSELQDFLDRIDCILSSDKPVSISVDVYINENNGENSFEGEE